ncbi:MAG: 7,8-didemethyl-8-hydroxy-5-deazariboflavin synthase subunit CofH [Nitrospinota bacterium]
MQTFAEAFTKAERGKEIGPLDAAALLCAKHPEETRRLFELADAIRAEIKGQEATYVVNRNMNFTNICVGSCEFCGFSRKAGQAGAYFVSDEEIEKKLLEAKAYGATEVCIQGGLPPFITFDYYPNLLRQVKKIAPELHIHAYSCEEINYMTGLSGKTAADVISILKDAGLGSTPGTAAEILVERVREVICPDKLSTERWVEIMQEVHRQGVPATSTIMFGHVEYPEEIGQHLEVIRNIQKETGGFTEFVPLPFIPYDNALGRRYNIRKMIPNEEVFKLYAVSRIYFRETIPNIQSSWPKIGLEAAGEALRVGCNDVGGTLMEEKISNMSGSQWGDRATVEDLREIIVKNGRIPVERTTVYERRESLDAAAPLSTNGFS